jgi:uncharacterized membrane protein
MMFFDPYLLYIREAIAMIGVVVITAGALRSLYQLYQFVTYEDYDASYIRLQFGDSVILGLEFMVGADIVGSLVQPNYYNLGLLAILVLVRTVLSYFLNLELEALKPRQRQAMK